MTTRNPCWCGNDQLDEFTASYGRCRSCGSLVLLGRPPRPSRVEDDDRDFYGRRYYTHLSEDYGYPDLAQRARNDLPERCLHWLRTVLKYRHPPAKILELGSAHGGFIALLHAAGFDATGLELSAATAEFARETFGVRMRVGPIEEQTIPPESLDGIALMDVLEHLPDPLDSLARCMDLLAPDGLLIIQTPRAPVGISHRGLVDANDPFLEQLKEQEHLYLFSEEGILRFLDRLGCSHVSFEPAIFPRYDMFLVASRTPPVMPPEWSASTSSSRLVQALLDLDDDRQNVRQQLAVAEADRAARLEVIQDLSAQLAESDADRSARLEVIHRLSAQLEAKYSGRQLLVRLAEALRRRIHVPKKSP